MIHFGGDFQALQLNIGIERGEQMIGWCGSGLGWRLLQGGILLERRVVTLHVPSFVRDA